MQSVMGITYNGLQLQEVGDFEDESSLPPLNLLCSSELHVTTEPPISCRCCYVPFFCCHLVLALLSLSFMNLLSGFLFKASSKYCIAISISLLAKKASPKLS